MKPLVLTFKGIRSYRGEQTIDLRQRTLVGIIGETGAGKSSVLEALHFALFGDCTWEAPTHKVLIADGGDGTLSVKLTFTTGNRTWIVERSISRDRATSVHRLISQDDGTIVTGRRAVDKRIREIIGMDQATFTKSVILPQGRFEQLLHMSPGERAGVLKKLLGLDDLDTIRDLARTRHEQLLPLLTELTTRRDGLETDPRAAVENAERRLRTVQAKLVRLRSIARTVAAASAKHTTLAAERDSIDAAQGRLRQELGGHDLAGVATLQNLARQLDDEGRAIKERLAPIEREIDELTNELGDRSPGRPEADAANNARISLTRIAEQLQQITELRGSVQDAAAGIFEREAAVEALTQAVDEADSRAEAAHKASTEQATEAQNVSASNAKATRLLAEVRSAAKGVSTYTERVENLDRRRQAANEALTHAQANFGDLGRRLDEANSQQAELQRLNSAAHAAEGLGPGDTCPVCSHCIDADFQPPATAELTTINKVIRELKKRHSAALQAVSDAKAEQDHVAKELPEVQMDLDTARRTYAGSLVTLTGVLGEFKVDDDDSVILSTTINAAMKAQERAVEATRERTRLQTAAAAQRATATAAAKELKTQTDHLASQRRTIDAHLAAVEAARKQLPTRYQPADTTDTAIATAAQTARLDHEQQARHTERLGQLRAEVAAANTDRTKLGKRYDRTVRGPAAQHRQRTQTLLHHHDTLADLLAVGHADAGDPAASIADQAAWTRASASRIEDLLSIANKRIEELATGIAETEAGIAAAIATAATNGRDLSEALEHEIGQEALAKQEHATLTTQIAMADDLQRRIEATRPHVQSLKVLVGLLSDAKFIGHIVADRQRALLANANALLGDMSRRQFAFADDFQIFDAHTGQLRDVKTMSGGETFQASLALALALVEQTALNGGRAEALFLDEGFGTLDRSALTHALDALQSQVQAGRLVVIISHMRAVADYVPDLLLVERGPAGSTARWASDRERADLAEEDLYGGLQE
ncbi:AAA family ATPase [Micromonospora tulbaghiae]|uniref:Nuclease SbcCD subunit C n=1 Tax=Micromonospora tulbaghiae TaxID=479978 RepID=A0ABY0KQQ2_9ACTN|nr:SMC family ATPase [Micromonospora tulbaghiae]SCF01071.1 exonuclease SbcC [Micromonospora tulbaghiae]